MYSRVLEPNCLGIPRFGTLSRAWVSPGIRAAARHSSAAGSFPTGAFNQLVTDSTSGTAYFPESNPKRNYVMQWNMSVARELSSTLAVTVGYVGSRGVHQPYRMDNTA